MTRIPAADRRRALMLAALRVVAARGVAQATTRAIVAEAQMSLASFHYAFESRDELMKELIEHVVEQEAAAILPVAFAACGPDAGPAVMPESLRDALRGGLQRYFEHLSVDPLREKAMLELTQYALRSPEMQHLARRQYDRYLHLAAQALDSAARRSESVWLCPVADVARLMVALSDGITIGWLVDRDDRAAAALLDRAADAVAALGRAA